MADVAKITYNNIFGYLLNSFISLMKQFKESVAQFAQEHIAPHAEKIDKTNYFPKVPTQILYLLITGTIYT